jgi:hypothetical protein
MPIIEIFQKLVENTLLRRLETLELKEKNKNNEIKCCEEYLNRVNSKPNLISHYKRKFKI